MFSQMNFNFSDFEYQSKVQLAAPCNYSSQSNNAIAPSQSFVSQHHNGNPATINSFKPHHNTLPFYLLLFHRQCKIKSNTWTIKQLIMSLQTCLNSILLQTIKDQTNCKLDMESFLLFLILVILQFWITFILKLCV